jgi:3-methyladenine DNA glycosylase AlkD
MLRRASDAKVAARARIYFKPHEKLQFHGVTTARAREIEKSLHAKVKGQWSQNEALRFCGILVKEGSQEAKGIGFGLLSRYHRSFQQEMIDDAEGWLAQDLCANWAAVDDLCPRVLTPLVRRFPVLIPRVKRWSRSRNLWLRRASAVTFVPMARHGECLDDCYAVAESLFGDSEDLIHKAVGWLLREAGRTDMKRLEKFLRQRGPAMPRTTVRYAIERFPETRRRALLETTRIP